MLNLTQEEARSKYCCRPNASQEACCTTTNCIAWVEEYETIETNDRVHKLAPPKTTKVKTGKGHCGLVYKHSG